MRTKFKDDLAEIYTIDRAAINLEVRNKLVTSLLNKISLNQIGMFTSILTELSDLNTPDQTVSVTAKQMLIKFQLPTFEQRRVAMEKDLTMGNTQHLLEKTEAIVDVLTDFFSHPNDKVRKNAMEIYIKRTFRAYEMGDLVTESSPNSEDIFSYWSYQAHWMADSSYIAFVKNSMSHDSLDEQSLTNPPKKRSGFFLFFKQTSSLSSNFPKYLLKIKALVTPDSSRNALQIALPQEKSIQSLNDEEGKTSLSFKNATLLT